MAVAFRTVKDLKLRTPSVLRDAQRHDVVITLRGRPVALLRRFSPAELEATVLLQSRRVRSRLQAAFKTIKAGKGVSVDEVITQAATVGPR